MDSAASDGGEPYPVNKKPRKAELDAKVSGKWSRREELIAEQLIVKFINGSLSDCEQGCTLRAYLSRKLQCAPMRISKKFSGQNLGKLVYTSSMSESQSVTAALAMNEWQQLRSTFSPASAMHLSMSGIASLVPTVGGTSKTLAAAAASIPIPSLDHKGVVISRYPQQHQHGPIAGIPRPNIRGIVSSNYSTQQISQQYASNCNPQRQVLGYLPSASIPQQQQVRTTTATAAATLTGRDTCQMIREIPPHFSLLDPNFKHSYMPSAQISHGHMTGNSNNNSNNSSLSGGGGGGIGSKIPNSVSIDSVGELASTSSGTPSDDVDCEMYLHLAESLETPQDSSASDSSIALSDNRSTGNMVSCHISSLAALATSSAAEEEPVIQEQWLDSMASFDDELIDTSSANNRQQPNSQYIVNDDNNDDAAAAISYPSVNVNGIPTGGVDAEDIVIDSDRVDEYWRLARSLQSPSPSGHVDGVDVDDVHTDVNSHYFETVDFG